MNTQATFNNKKSVTIGMTIRIIINTVLFIIIILSIFPISGHWDWWQAWIGVALMVVSTVISRLIVARLNPSLIHERITADKQINVKKWDKFLMPIIAIIAPLAIFFTAAFDIRTQQGPVMPVWANIIAVVIFILGTMFSTWAMVVNRYFSALVRIQTDRGQTVCQDGPYRLVRHPGYAGGLLACMVLPFLLGSWWALIPAGVYLVTIIVRTALEDHTLQAELPGYKEYTSKTRFRLIPGIW